MIAEPQRSIRKHIACAFQLRCLQDFSDGTRHWPLGEDFARRHIDYTYRDVQPYQQYRWLLKLHAEVSQVYYRLLHLCGLPNETALPPAAAHPRVFVGVKIGERVRMVPSIPRSQLLKLVWQAPAPSKPHPVQLHDRQATLRQVQTVVQLRKRLRRLLLPIFEDLQFRLAFRLLPVRSRLSPLTPTNPDIIFCLRNGCNAVETERHLFFECTLPASLWPLVFRDWSTFFQSTPSWLDIALGRTPQLRPTWEHSVTQVQDLWQVLRCVILHTLWSFRNKCIFEGKEPPPLLPTLRVVYTTFSAHVRAYKRHRPVSTSDSSIQGVLDVLRSSQSLGGFMRANTQLFAVRFLA